MRSRLRSLLAFAVLAAVACSHDSAVPPEVEGVYGLLLAARADHEVALAAMLAGDGSGENLVRAASTRLLVAVREIAAALPAGGPVAVEGFTVDLPAGTVQFRLR